MMAALFLVTAAAPVTPSWMRIDAAKHEVKLDIIAGFNPNDGALNFNGYFDGDMTVVVPTGWTVEIAFKNQDAMLPHSLLVTRAYEPSAIPQQAGVDAVAVPRAYSDKPEEGIPSPGTDKLRFVVKEAGDFYFLCGAPGHAQGGMWTKFKVDAGASAPYVIVEDGAALGRQ